MNQTSTKLQVSAGGVAFRRQETNIDVALISVGEKRRWQLPKGIVGTHEAAEDAALREVREETGLETELVCEIDKIEYWYFSNERGQQVRYHKFVHFYLLRYLFGDVQNHDYEVNEACWFPINEASTRLAFKGEKRVLEQAKKLIEQL